MANMDRSLDEIIAQRPERQNNGNRGRRPQPRRREGSYREDRVDLDLDWVHDKYEDDRDTRPSRAQRRPRGDRYSPEAGHGPTGSKLRIENLHYDITESDLEDLFTSIGPVSNLSLVYDRAGRSEGLAFVTYNHPSDARTAITEFDGANAKGQPIRVTLISTRRDRNPFDNVERPRGSLFDRVERPRDARSLSPGAGGSDTENSAPRRRGGRRAGGAGGAAGGRYRRSDVSKPAPEHIDRYVPGQRRSPGPRTGGGANSGRRQGGGEGRRTGNPRPRKTQEELDAEMDDYWGAGAGTGAAGETAPAEQSAQPAAAAAPAAAAPAGGDDDIDMIE